MIRRNSSLLSWALLPLVLVLATSVARAQPLGQEQRAKVSKAVANASGYKPGDKGMAAVVLDVKEGNHAQSRTPTQEYLIKFDVKPEENPAVTFGEVVYPPGKEETYPDLGKLSVYTGRVVFYIPFEVKPDAKPGELKIAGRLTYQICDDKSCYPPERPKFTIDTKLVAPGEAVTPAESELFKDAPKPGQQSRAAADVAATSPSTAPSISEQARGEVSSGGLEGSNWSFGYAMGAAFIAGLLFNIMPCVLPVLPLKAAGFYEAAGHSRARSVALGLVFGAGIITVFAILALLVLVFRAITWGELFSKGWFIWSIVILLTAMAFGLFGAYTFRLPMGAYTFEPRHDTFFGNYLLGAVTAILATPCTAPLLPPLLLWASSQPPSLGVPAFLMVGVGMAFPYAVLSATPELARRFPRTGPFSELFKQMMGFLLLASAAYFAAGRLIHGPEFFWVVVAVVAVSALYLVARTVQLTKDAVPVAVSSALAIVLLGTSLWWTAKITGIGTAPAGVATRGGASADWVPYSADRFAALRAEGKPVLVKFTANWCATCQAVEVTVFRDPAVWDALARHDVVAMKVDLSDDDAPGKDLLLKLNPAGGIPLTAVFSAKLPQPILLSSIYRSDALLSAIDRATGPTVVAAQ